MHKISEIISKQVLTLYEGVNVGTIKSFFMDYKQNQIKGFYVFNDESEAYENYVSAKKIFSVGESTILVKNLECISTNFNSSIQPEIINLNAITLSGNCLGKVIDVYFDESYYICAYETNKGVIISPEKLVSLGKDVAFFDLEEKNISFAKLKPKNKINLTNFPEIKVSILEDDEIVLKEKTTKNIPIISGNFDQNSFLEEKKIDGNFNLQAKKQEISIPQKFLANPKTKIIGKTATKTIIGLNGEVVVRDMQKITKEIYEKAKKHSKLFELESCVN